MLGGLDFELDTYVCDPSKDTWWADLFWKCAKNNKMLMRDFLTVFNGGSGMVLAVSPDNTKDILHSISDSKIIGKVK